MYKWTQFVTSFTCSNGLRPEDITNTLIETGIIDKKMWTQCEQIRYDRLRPKPPELVWINGSSTLWDLTIRCREDSIPCEYFKKHPMFIKGGGT